jgi:hypothetical protein
MNNNYNQILQQIIGFANSGKNPQAIMQMLLQKNPQYNQTMAQLQNMAQGRPMNEFVMQLARQNGVNEQNMAQLMQMFGK